MEEPEDDLLNVEEAQKPSSASNHQTTQEVTHSTPTIKPKKAWPVATSWISFIAIALPFLALGPGSIIVAAISSPYAWLVSAWWAPHVYEIIFYITPLVIILSSVSLFFTYRKYPSQLKTVTTLSCSIIIGLLFTWLCTYNIIPMNYIIYAIVISVIVLIPIIVLIVFRVRKKKSINKMASTLSRKSKILFIAIFVALIAELIFAVVNLVEPIQDLTKTIKQEIEKNAAIDSASKASGAKSSKHLAGMVYAICDGEYDVVYQSTEESGLFQCEKDSKVFSIIDPHENLKDESWSSIHASYYGTTYNETVEKYFPNTRYFYRGYLGTADLVFLVEAESESEVIAKYTDAIFNYIKDESHCYLTCNEERANITIFYTDDISDVNNTLDYVLLAGLAGPYDCFNNHNCEAVGKYMFDRQEDVISADIKTIAHNPSLYSAQTRDAIKIHRRIFTVINVDSITTKEELRTLLENSFQEAIDVK